MPRPKGPASMNLRVSKHYAGILQARARRARLSVPAYTERLYRQIIQRRERAKQLVTPTEE